MKKLVISLAILCCFISTESLSADIKIIGTIDIKKPISKNINEYCHATNLSTPTISLLKLTLNKKAKRAITNRINKIKFSNPSTDNSLLYPEQIDLGMNNTPVLNQGIHGSCVVFAVTAAIDAIIGKGDYVSQLCQLGLGRYLENNGHTTSGWDGAWNRTILSQIDLFGFTSKDAQRANGCAGLTEYPMCGLDVIAEESASDFHKISESLPANSIAWSSIVDVYQVVSDKANEEEILLKVKKALASGDRVTFGALLLNFNEGIVGAMGSYKQKFDSWVMTPEIEQEINSYTNFAGHAMLITGYDDNAIAKDQEGRTYKGLFTIRNSWGKNIGDKGDFYMSYDYFKSLALEAQQIRHT